MARPEGCEPAAHWRADVDDLHSRIEVRVANGNHGGTPPGGEPTDDGRLLLWIRPRDGLPVNSSLLAIMADFIPGVSVMPWGGTPVATASTTPSATADRADRMGALRHHDHRGPRRLAHGSMYLFAEDGAADGDGEPVDDRAGAGGRD